MENASRQISIRALGRSLEPTSDQGTGSGKSGYKILLAGQSGPAAIAAAAFLSQTNHRVARVQSLEATLALVSSGSVDLILADSCREGLSAIDLCRILKRSPVTQFLPTFVLWGQGDSEAEAQAI